MGNGSADGRALPSAAAAGTEVVACATEMSDRGLVNGRVGNVSVRLDDCILITPSRLPYALMSAADLVRVSATGERLSGSRSASREMPLHLAVYRSRPDVGALVHTHSPHATAWSFLGEPLPQTEESSYYGIGEVRVNPPAPSGSTELAESATKTLAGSSAVLLGRHGVLAAGVGLAEALEVAIAVEHQAQIALLLRAVGGPT